MKIAILGLFLTLSAFAQTHLNSLTCVPTNLTTQNPSTTCTITYDPPPTIVILLTIGDKTQTINVTPQIAPYSVTGPATLNPPILILPQGSTTATFTVTLNSTTTSAIAVK